MSHFTYVRPTPVLPSYLLDADLTSVVIPPQVFTVVPSADGVLHLHWDKHRNTVDTNSDLYTEVWRSTDLASWALLDTRQWLNYDYYADSQVLNGLIYYYRLRFVRLDVAGVIYTASEYTATCSARPTTQLGLEPADSCANKFLAMLLNNLPGTRIYDRTTAATFSADEYEWQTTCRVTDAFNVYADGTVVDSQPADATATTTKRPISFMVSRKHVRLQAQNLLDGQYGEQVLMNAYLIHTFLYGYARQFMTLYETYAQLLANKFLDNTQTYTQGFTPALTSQKVAPISELYNTIGKFLRLPPLRSQTVDQGVMRYKQMIRDSFTNLNNTGKVKGIHQACTDVLGISTPSLLEYHKQHWFKPDREQKVYTLPSLADVSQIYTGLPWKSGGNHSNNLIYHLNDYNFSTFVEYVADVSGIGLTGDGKGWLEVLGSGPSNPYTYLFRAHISTGKTTGDDVQNLFQNDPIAAALLTVTPSLGGVSSAVIYSGMNTELVRMHSLWAAWEDTLVNLYGRKLQLKDTISTLVTGTDSAIDSITVSKTDPTHGLAPNIDRGKDMPGYITDIGYKYTPTDSLVIARDDSSEGVGAGIFGSTAIIGDKRVLFRINLTAQNMQWVTRATLKLFVLMSTGAGFLRLYRIKKNYTYSKVCWNYRNGINVSSGYKWNGQSYVVETGDDWVTADWATAGAADTADAVFLKEFYLPKIEADAPTQVALDVTDVIQQLYKYETSRLSLGEDPMNVLNTGFMLTAEGFENRSMVVFTGHTATDVIQKPKITWEKLPHGFFTCPKNSTRYFYVDGTTRYGRLQVLQAASEPLSYVRTVHERIPQESIRFTDDVTVVLTGVPASVVAGVRLYGETSKAVGTVSSVSETTLYVSMDLRVFAAGETLHLLDNPTVTVVVVSVSYVGNKYIRLSRVPTSDSIIRVYHTGSSSAIATPPADYPNYATWSEAAAGVSPVFLSAAIGTANEFFTRDTENTDIIYLNTEVDVATVGAVVVTYQYMYDYILLGRVDTDGSSIYNIEGCNRVGKGLFSQRENDYLYKTELLLPAPSTGTFPDISGDTTVDDYSDHNIDVLCEAIHNVRRLDGKVSVFKYGIEGKPYYRFGQTYHEFFREV